MFLLFLSAVQSRDKGNAIIRFHFVSMGAFQLPVDVVYKDEDTGADVITGGEQVMSFADELCLDPSDEVTQGGYGWRHMHSHTFLS